MIRAARLLTLLLPLALVACDSTGEKGALDVVQDTADLPPELATVETTLDAQTIAAGGAATVSCGAYDQYGDPFTANLGFEVFGGDGSTDPGGVTVEGQTITATHAGVYRVMCAFGGPPRVEDTSPVALVVEAGGPASVQTRLFVDRVTAGTTVSVGCTVKDANGNAAAAETVVRVSPDDGGATVTGRVVRFTGAGTYEVVCATADGALVGDDPHTIEVVPGPLERLRTTLTPDSIQAGERVDVDCYGEDAFGNAVDVALVFTLPQDGVDFLDATRLALTSTRSGSYAIACTPKEAWVQAVEVPATLTVEPGDPAALALDVTPQRNVYNINARVTVTPRLADAWGNPITDRDDALQVEARYSGALRQTVAPGEKVDLDAEGDWVLSVATGAPWNLTASRDLIVDGSAPAIDVVFPARGAMVTSSGGQLTVTGSVTDAAGGLAEVRINGAAQALTPGTRDYPLAYRMSPRHGMNTLTIEAIDVSGAKTRVAQSFMVGSSWKPSKTRFDKGIVVHLARAFLDDGVRTGDVDDLATIFARVMNAIDVGSFIDSPAATYAGYDVYIEDISYDPVTVALAPSAGVLELSLRVGNLYAHIDADGFIDADGDINIDAIEVTMQLDVAVVNGQPRVTERALVVNVLGLDIDVHWSINWIIDLFSNRIRDELSGAFADSLRQQVPEELEEALAGLAIAETFSVPSFLPGMAPITLSLSATPTALVANVDGLDLDLGTRVDAIKRVPWSAPGSLLRDACFGADAERAVFSGSKRLGFALSTDVLNQILFHVWWGGGLEIALEEADLGDVDLSEYGVSDLSLALSGRMPPVLTDCLDNDLRIQLGELNMDLSLKLAGAQLDLGLVVSFETTATITVDDDGVLGLALGAIAPEDILIDIVSVESDIFNSDHEDTLIQLLREQLLGSLLEDLTGQSLASFPLPEIDLGSLADDLQGQVIAIDGVTIARERGFVVLEGDP